MVVAGVVVTEALLCVMTELLWYDSTDLLVRGPAARARTSPAHNDNNNSNKKKKNDNV